VREGLRGLVEDGSENWLFRAGRCETVMGGRMPFVTEEREQIADSMGA
jgi:hypothetical protein